MRVCGLWWWRLELAFFICFKAPFKKILLISSRSLSRVRRNTAPRKKPPDLPQEESALLSTSPAELKDFTGIGLKTILFKIILYSYTTPIEAVENCRKLFCNKSLHELA